MNILPKALSKLIESFERLPGIGPKTAQRLSFYLLHVPQEELDAFSDSVRNLRSNTVFCSICKNVAASDPCPICDDNTRDQTTICVVEQPTDVLSIEKTGTFRGVYHVLHGAIDPLNNIGPDEIYIAEIVKRAGADRSRVREVILATNPNVEGEATAMYIHKQLSTILPAQAGNKQQSTMKITRLAHGLPVGADIEYADEVTLSRAIEGRREYI